MKIGIIQCDVTTGDLRGNADKLKDAVGQCAGADICLAPAFALSGPIEPCVAHSPDFQAAQKTAENSLARALENAPPLLYADIDGARLLQNGIAVVPAGEFYLAGKRLLAAPLFGRQMPAAAADVDLLLCPGAIPFRGETPAWERWRAHAAANVLSLAVCNLVGGNGKDIYMGGSLAADFNGRILDVLPVFMEAARVVDGGSAGQRLPGWEPLEAIYEALVLGLRDFIHKCGAKSAVLGLSGGMDSAVVAALAAAALGPQNVTGLLMPSCFSSAASLTDARLLAENLGIRALEIPIDALMEDFEQALKPAYELFPPAPGDVTRQNIQARARGVLLSAVSNRSGALVLNTGNKSEAAMGYFTLYGDSAGALAVIGDLYKTEVYALAAHINARARKELIPQNIFDKPPSAELAPNQKDEDSLPPYDELDKILRALLEKGAAPTALAREVRAKMYAAEFKRRQCPPALVVSQTPLSGCRRPVGGKMDFGEK